MTARVQVSAFQRDEVGGLLDVCADDFANGDRDDEGWGALDGDMLTVAAPDEAVDDLEYRAQYLVDEGYVAGSNGTAGARSLRRLAASIREAAR